MNLEHPDMIDSYLRGDLSAAEMVLFEQKMQVDPVFSEQVQFERYVKDGIGQFRKAELKGRLNAIDVSSGWVGSGIISNGFLTQTVGGVVFAGLIGLLAYKAYEANVDPKPVASVTVEIPSPKKMEKVTPLEIPHNKPDGMGHESASSEEDSNSPSIVSAELTPEKALSDESGKQPEDDVFTEKEGVSRELTVDVRPPNLNEVDSEEALHSTEVGLPDLESLNESKEINEPLDVQTINKRLETLKYKYFDGKLFLYGDFGTQPYEILEINKPDGRRIYVFYDSKYYSADVTNKIVDLPRVTNSKQIAELEILRNNKLAE